MFVGVETPTYVICHPELVSGSYKPVVSPTSQPPFTAIRHLRPKVGDPAFLNYPKISNKLDPQTTSEDDARWMCLMFTDKLNVGLVNPTYNSPLLWERIEHLTQSVKSVLGEGLSRREQYDNCPLTLALSRKAREILLFRNNFPLSIFNFPFIQKENRRVRFNSPQPTTKEVLPC